ncbi:zinc-ribbon domain-containing protein [Dankookia sp. GCM10030260]|uniref:zinc-ribbon domain-containing protein n=1 Tax=Dankookia sp. GCM10030260 TaxID=3273390 RepID=UPI00361EDECF
MSATLAADRPRRHSAATMRIICPACAAAYEVPDRLLGTGRSLRCRSCGHAWRVAPPAAGAPIEAAEAGRPPAAAAVPLPPLPEPPPTAPLRRAPQIIDPPLPRPSDLPLSGGIALRLAWGASLLAVAGMGLALWLFRAEIVEAWPPAARLYLMFGATAQG